MAGLHSYWKRQWQWVESSRTVPTTHASLIEVRFDGRRIDLFCNGDPLGGDPDQDRNTAPGPLTIGGRYGRDGAYFRGDIAELLIHDRVLGEGERQSVYEYLRSRYALW
jgi:hypothetical protein